MKASDFNGNEILVDWVKFRHDNFRNLILDLTTKALENEGIDVKPNQNEPVVLSVTQLYNVVDKVGCEAGQQLLNAISI